MDKFLDRITDLTVTSKFDHKRFLPAGCISELITQESITEILQTAPSDLVNFIYEKAKRVFATVLSSVPKSDLVSIMKSFQRHEFTDDHLPIQEVTNCKVKKWLKCTHTCNLRMGDGCSHPPTLDTFHHRPWKAHSIETFYTSQWKFLSPVFTKYKFKHEFHSHYILPITEKSLEVRESHFSQVYEIRIHDDHQQVVPAVRDTSPADVCFFINEN